MKRLLTIAAALLVAGLFALPSAAIASLDGTEPVFDGSAGIMPLSDTIEIIGEPTDEQQPPDTNLDGQIIEHDRSHLARSEERPVQSFAVMTLAGFAVLGLMSLAALLLSSIALLKVRRMKAAEAPAAA